MCSFWISERRKAKEIKMSFRSLVGRVFGVIGTGLLVLSLVGSTESIANAWWGGQDDCQGCSGGCSSSSSYDQNGILQCGGSCYQAASNESCSASCKCVVNANKSGCNCVPLKPVVVNPVNVD